MKKLITAIVSALILSSCSVTYYSYYEVEDLDDVSAVSRQDAEWTRSGKTPTRCVTVYPDSTGRTVYLMETEIKRKK